MAVRTFDFKKVSMIVGGIPITGFADGTGIMVSLASDAYTKVSGADGVVSRAKSNDYSGEITITLSQTSPANDYLTTIALADELSGAGVVPVSITDNGGTTKIASAFAWIRKKPDVEFGKEISDREWVLDCAELTLYFVGGNVDATLE